MDYDDLKGKINRDGANLKCKKLKKILESAGFKVRKCKGSNHHICTHDGLKGFTTVSFDGGHGDNPKVLKCYIRNISKIIDKYKEELKVFLEKNQ